MKRESIRDNNYRIVFRPDMVRLPKSFWFAAAFHWVALIYFYWASQLPRDCTRFAPVLVGLVFTPAMVVVGLLGADLEAAGFTAAFIQCVAYTWLFFVLARRQARAREAHSETHR